MGANYSTPKKTLFKAVPFLLLALLGGSLTLSLTPGTEAAAMTYADNSFKTQWETTDRPVQDGAARRSWVWGGFYSEGKNEAYSNAPGGQRLVQYFDKARMEINNPNAPRDGRFFVSNGLLVTDMVSGMLQVGDQDFTPNPVGPARVQVAGDPDNAAAPTYASFAGVASINGSNRAADQTGQKVGNTISKDGVPGNNPGAASYYGVTNTHFENTLGHNIPGIFWTYLSQQGPIISNGNLTNGTVITWEVAIGLPITEAYWSRAIVNGQEKDVLIQLFQRRILTYTPSNDEAFRVEMGNVGQHYFRWRYLTAAPAPATTQAPVTTASLPTPTATKAPTPKPVTPTKAVTTVPTTKVPQPTTPLGTLPPSNPTTVNPPPAGGSWSEPIQGQTPVDKSVIRVRPTDGQVFTIGENKGLGFEGIFVSGSGNNFSSSINLKPGSGGEKVSADFDNDGNLHVFWQEGGNDVGLQTFYARVNASGKQDWLRNMGNELAAGNSTGLPNVFYNRSTRHLYLSQEENPQTVVFYESADNGFSWGNRTVIASGNSYQTNSRIVADNNGNVHLVWNRLVNDHSEVFAADRINNKWTTPVNITQFNGDWNTPIGGLALASNGDIYFTYISPAPKTIGVGFIRYDASTQRWGNRRDNVGNMPPDSGSMKSVRVAVSTNGTIWIGFSLNDPNNQSRSGAYYLISTDGGATWSGQAPIFLREGAGPGDIYSYTNNIYYVGTYGGQTLVSLRGQ